MRSPGFRRTGVEVLLAAGGHVSVLGDCMAPHVPRNASIGAEPCEHSSLRPGDVVLVERAGKLVMHRFLARLSIGGHRRLLVKADGRWRPDAPLPVESLVARLSEIRDGRVARPYSPRALDRIRAAALGFFWTLLLRLAPNRRRDAAERELSAALLVRSTLARGGLALHAASVRTRGGVLLFVGPVGAGKSTAARAFPKRARLDDDLVLITYDEKSRRWTRLDRSEECAPGRSERAGAEELPIRAVLLPEPGDAFRLTPLRGREAFVKCLQLPFCACPPDDPRAAEELRPVMARVEKLCADVPVRRLVWKAGEDLPALLERAL